MAYRAAYFDSPVPRCHSSLSLGVIREHEWCLPFVRIFPDMCSSCASAVDVDIGDAALEGFVAEHGFSHGRAADVAEADDED